MENKKLNYYEERLIKLLRRYKKDANNKHLKETILKELEETLDEIKKKKIKEIKNKIRTSKDWREKEDYERR